MFGVVLSAAYKYDHADHYFGYAPFDAHEDGFIVPSLELLMEEASTVVLARLLTLCSSNPVMIL